MMNKIICILIIVIASVALIASMFYIANVLDHNSFVSDVPTITFDQFINLYKIAPSKWNIDPDWYVKYEGDYRERLYFKTLLDEKRYKDWHSNKQKMYVKQQIDQCNLKLLKCWQEDIDQYREKYIEELKELQDKIEIFDNKYIK